MREALTQGVDNNLSTELNRTDKNFNTKTYSHFNSSQFKSSGVSESYSASPYENIIASEDANKPLGIAVTKLKNDYLLAQNQQGLLVINLPHARQVLAQQQIELSLSTQDKLISKPVLIPFNLSLKVNAQEWLDKYDSELQSLGIEFAVLGEHEVMVRQVPAMLNATDLKESINQFVKSVMSGEVSFIDALVKIIINDDFSNSPRDWNALLRDLENNGLDEKYYHQVSDNDLSGWFK